MWLCRYVVFFCCCLISHFQQQQQQEQTKKNLEVRQIYYECFQILSSCRSDVCVFVFEDNLQYNTYINFWNLIYVCCGISINKTLYLMSFIFLRHFLLSYHIWRSTRKWIPIFLSSTVSPFFSFLFFFWMASEMG